jgi:hypothetical protein
MANDAGLSFQRRTGIPFAYYALLARPRVRECVLRSGGPTRE